MSKHISGPWSAVSHSTEFPRYSIEKEVNEPIVDGKRVLAHVIADCYNTSPYGDIEANANLIAQSPLMLDELKETKNTLKLLLDSEIGDAEKRLIEANIYDLDKLIAKAEGV